MQGQSLQGLNIMACASLESVNGQFRAQEHAQTVRAADGQLLSCFIRDRDDWAFAELVRRHGSMVLGVCRRVLGNAHDAEDCFQATFLVLVRKATTIVPRDMVGNWLYGVAYRTALEARKLASRRRIMERKKPVPIMNDDSASSLYEELGPVLDQELERLPEKYRSVLIVCDLEGKTREEAACELDVPAGTIASRLARARALLAKRLRKYSLRLSPTALGALLSDIGPTPSNDLLDSTVKAGLMAAAGLPLTHMVAPDAITLANRVVRGFLVAKLEFASACMLIVLALGMLIGAFMPSAHAERKPDADPEARKTAARPKKIKPRTLPDCILRKLDESKITVEAADASSIDPGASIHYDLRIEQDTRILVDGRESKLAELKLGATLNIEWQPDAAGQLRATRIEAVGLVLTGVVHAVGEDTLILQAADQASAKTFQLEPSAEIKVNGKKAKLADLKVKMKATVKFTNDKPGVVCVEAVGDKIAGRVKAVRKDLKGLELEGVAEGISVPEDAPIVIDGKQRRFDEIQPGMTVTIRLGAALESRCVIAVLVQ